jgi:hypothetical protein
VSQTNELFEAVKALPPEQKVRLFGFLGMLRVGDSHQPECPVSNSMDCNCVPPESTWTHPEDVEVYLEDTWEQRLAYAEKRAAARESSGL